MLLSTIEQKGSCVFDLRLRRLIADMTMTVGPGRPVKISISVQADLAPNRALRAPVGNSACFTKSKSHQVHIITQVVAKPS